MYVVLYAAHEMKKQLQDLTEKGGFVLVLCLMERQLKTRNGNLRMCMDYRALNRKYTQQIMLLDLCIYLLSVLQSIHILRLPFFLLTK